MTTSNDPDEIRADIERTRATLSDDVDDLAEASGPRTWQGVRSARSRRLRATSRTE